jgi:hypothetical protein
MTNEHRPDVPDGTRACRVGIVETLESSEEERMNAPDKCPLCSSEHRRTDAEEYKCGTVIPVGAPKGFIVESIRCVRLQRDQLRAQVEQWKAFAERLEEAGSTLRKRALGFALTEIEAYGTDQEFVPMSEVNSLATVYYDDGPTAGDHLALTAAMNDWQKAKETKP